MAKKKTKKVAKKKVAKKKVAKKKTKAKARPLPSPSPAPVEPTEPPPVPIEHEHEPTEPPPPVPIEPDHEPEHEPERVAPLVLAIGHVQGGGGPPWVIAAAGLSLIVRADMRPGLTAKGETDHAGVYPNGVVWRTTEPLLGLPAGELSFTAIALEGDPRMLAEEPVSFRLTRERPALELRLEIDLPARVVRASAPPVSPG